MSAALSYLEDLAEEERLADESAFRWSLRHPNPDPPAPPAVLAPRDGDLLLIGRSGAADEVGHAELLRRYRRYTR